MAGEQHERSLELTPTFSVAVICVVFVLVSFLGERTLHFLGKWLLKTKRKPLFAALEKMKEELMLLGLISLLITVASPSISKTCVKTSSYDKIGRHFLPCKQNKNKGATSEHLLIRRQLSSSASNCANEGEEPLISYLALEQLHRFIFVMGCTHVVYTCLTMLLAILKVNGWEKWEHEAHQQGTDKVCMAGLCKDMTSKRQSAFVAHHTSTPGSQSKLFIWVICFWRQFGQSVTRADYWALRLGFIMKHRTSIKYDFHRYMIRSMEDEFKDVIGISPLFWVFVVLFMLFNIDGSNLYFWIAFLPVVLVLITGAKLQRIIAQLAIESTGLSGRLDLKPRDSLFWFGRPRLMLQVINFVFFQDAFQLATFCWVWWQFGWESCFLKNKAFLGVRLVSGFLVQVLCSYSTLPLYALVTQMGSEYKKALFRENVVQSLNHWKMVATRNKGRKQAMQQQEESQQEESRNGNSLTEDVEDDVEASSDSSDELQEVVVTSTRETPQVSPIPSNVEAR